MYESWNDLLSKGNISIMERGAIYAAILFVAENEGIGKDIFIRKYGTAFWDTIRKMAKEIKY